MRLSPFSLKFPLSAGLRDLHASLSGRLSWRPKSSDAVQPLAQPPAVPPSQGPQSRRVPGVPAVMAVEHEPDKCETPFAFHKFAYVLDRPSRRDRIIMDDKESRI